MGVEEAMDSYNNPTFALNREQEDYPGLIIEYGRMVRVQFLKLAGVASRKLRTSTLAYEKWLSK
jgi:hypothetical protein